MSRRILTAGRQAFASLAGIIFVAFFATATVLGGASGAEANSRYAAYVVDVQSGKVLFSRYAGDPRFPASLTKMMTLYMLFEQLQAGRLSLESRITMSRHAAAQPPSKIGLKPGQTIRVEDAILALVTRSANDVAAAIGEHLAGSEKEFGRRMTAKARALGMSSTSFRNASGLPDPAQKTSARDMALLGIALSQHFPDYYKYFSARSFRFAGTTIRGHNRLLGTVEGVDGIKTGYIRASGFNLVTSVRRDGRHLVAVVMGGRTSRSRDDHMRELIAEHMPKASRRRSDPVLIARTAPMPTVPARAEPLVASVAAIAPVARVATEVPTPLIRPRDRVAAAHELVAAADPVVAAMAANEPAPVEQGSTETEAEMTVSAYAPESDPGAAAAAAVGGGWLVQIAAVDREAMALDMLSTAKSKVGAALASAAPVTEKIEKGGTTLYRARFAGFDKSTAQAACAALKRKDYNCFPIKN